MPLSLFRSVKSKKILSWRESSSLKDLNEYSLEAKEILNLKKKFYDEKFSENLKIYNLSWSDVRFGENDFAQKVNQLSQNKDIMILGDLKSKLSSFGCETHSVNGHSIKELFDTFSNQNTTDKTKAIVANTIKGKGLSFAENNNKFHHQTSHN